MVSETNAQTTPAAPSGQTMLAVEQLRAGYKGSQVLRDVSLAIAHPQVVGLLGRNGAGKTTLLQTITGFIKPTAGRVRLDGRDITRERPENIIRLGVGYVPQEHAVFRTLTVRDNLQLGAGLRAGAKITVDEIVQLFPRLGERFSQRAGTLSGGERKMLAIARALLCDPRLLILDEPTEGVWPTVIQELTEKLAVLGQTRSILLVEQHIGTVLDLAQQVYVLDRGSVVLRGTPAEVSEGDQLYRYLAP